MKVQNWHKKGTRGDFSQVSFFLQESGSLQFCRQTEVGHGPSECTDISGDACTSLRRTQGLLDPLTEAWGEQTPCHRLHGTVNYARVPP